MKIQYFSDLHLEFRRRLPLMKVPVRAPVLILAGDIGCPFKPEYALFLEQRARDFDKVFLCRGNHEMYDSKSAQEVDSQIQTVIRDLSNISYLNDSYEEYGGYRFVGSTLWGRITDPKYVTNDFRNIPWMSISKYNEMHAQSRESIRDSITSSRLPVVVITHFLPSMRLVDPFYAKYSRYNQCYASNCEDLFLPPVVAWFYGHTHRPSRRTLDGLPFYCNPIGYPDENAEFTFEECAELKT